MAKISNSELKAAVSAIMERDQSETPRSQMSQRADLSALSRTHREQLQSEFAKAGVDFGRLEKLHSDYKKEARRLIEKQMPSVDSKPVRPTESDQKWTQNKKRAYELIGGRPSYTFPVVIDAAEAIYSLPAGALVDSHIESWNSWARWYHETREYGSAEYRHVGLKFLFAWQNNSPNPVVVKNASADILTRGFCTVLAFPPAYFFNRTVLYLDTYHRVHVGQTDISGDEFMIVPLSVVADGYLILGQAKSDRQDLDKVTTLRCQDIVVDAHQTAVFEVGVKGSYSIYYGVSWGEGDGQIQYVFTGETGRIACPSVTLEVSPGIHFP